MLKYIIFITEEKIPELKELKVECKKKKIELCFMLPEENTLIEETLYITDHEEICEGLLEEGANVLVWLHTDPHGGLLPALLPCGTHS